MTERLILENDVTQLILLNGFIEETGRKFGLNEERIGELNLVLEEAVSNVIFYAYPGKSGCRVEVSLTKENGILEVVICDSGLPFDPTGRLEPDIHLAPDEREIGGLGIFLVRQIMDTVRYSRENGQNVLRMTLNL